MAITQAVRGSISQRASQQRRLDEQIEFTLFERERGIGRGGVKATKGDIMPRRSYAAFKSVAPYFDLARTALGDLVDGTHFFDVLNESTVYEVLYDLGWPRIIRGRTALMAAFRDYAETIAIHAADHLVTHKTDDGSVVVIEYEVHGEILATGVDYDNRFCSIIRVEDRKVAHWRDYMDSLAAWNALHARGR
jgi:uncharacterized protein